MKILVVCQYYDPEPARIADISAALVRRGHEVSVVTGTPNYPEGEIYPGYEGDEHRDETLHGVRVHRCPIHPRHRGAIHRLWNYLSFVWASNRYLRTVEEDFDVVLVNQLSPVMMGDAAVRWAKRHGKKVVLYCLDLWPESLKVGGIREGSPVFRLFWHWSRWIYRGCSEILMTSRGFEPYFRETLRLPEAKLGYLPQYAEDLFADIPAVTAHEPPYRFVFAGNIGELQSVETIVEAAKLLREDDRIHIDIVGGGISLEACQALGAGLPNLTFHGRRDVTEMPGFYAQADAMLITLGKEPTLSLTLPGKVQSYLSAGRGVVGAIDGETPLVLSEGQCGVCVPAEDAEGLANAMRELADHPDRFTAWGQNARTFYGQHFRKEVFLDTLEQALHRNCVK